MLGEYAINVLSRRAFLGASAGLLGTCVLPARANITGVPPRYLNTEQTLQAWMRLGGALDDRLVIWWMDGIRYGVLESRSKALYGMKVGIFQRFLAQPDGTWKIAMFELTYYTDLETGRLLETWQNPYTGETNTVRHVRLGPEIRLQTDEGQLANPDDKAMQSMIADYHTTLGPGVVSGDQLWLPTSVEAVIKFPKPTAPDIRFSHYTTVMGDAAAGLDPDVISAPCTLAFQNVLKWEPWMNMRDHAGNMMSRAYGRKMESPEELPADYLEMAREIHPWLIKDPMETLKGKVEEIRGPT